MPTMPATFRAPWQPTREERDRETDRLRGSARERGYSVAWDKASRGFLLRHPICAACEAAGLIVAAEVTDHVIPHKGDMGLFWDRSRWQGACTWHHNVVKQILERLFEDGAIGEADLWLTSAYAQRIAKRERGC